MKKNSGREIIDQHCLEQLRDEYTLKDYRPAVKGEEEGDKRPQPWQSKLLRKAITDLVFDLTPMEQQIVYLRYWRDRTFDEIGHEMRIRTSSVERILEGVLHELRNELVQRFMNGTLPTPKSEKPKKKNVRLDLCSSH